MLEKVAEDHRPPAQRIGQDPVVIEAGAQFAERPLETGFPLELLLANCLQHLEARAFVRFGENHVEPDHGHLVVVGQAPQQLSDRVAPPGPASDLGQAFLVDIDDDHLRIDGIRHGEPDTRIVQIGVQRRDERDLPEFPGVTEQRHDAKGTEDEAGQVL